MTAYGMKGHVGISLQQSYGTSITTSNDFLPVTDESLELTIEQLQEENMYARFGQSPTHVGMAAIEGDINMEADPIGMGKLLRVFCGSYTAPTSGNYLHQYQMSNADHSSRAAGTPFTAEIYRDTGSAFLYYDLIADTLEITATNGELTALNVNVMGAGFGRKAAATPTYPDGGTPFKFDQASVSFASAAMGDLRELTITCAKNLEMIYTLQNTNTPYKIKRSDTEKIEVSGTLLFQSHSYMQAFEAQSENQFVINFASNSGSFKIDMPAFKFITFPVQMSGKTFIEVGFTGEALFSTTSNSAIRFELTNTRSLGY